MGEMVRHLQSCAFVVTQNSAAAFSGYFFGKPALFFGQIDFHHIGVRADLADLSHSFDAVGQAAPDFAAYIRWFWQEHCINAGRATPRMTNSSRPKGGVSKPISMVSR